MENWNLAAPRGWSVHHLTETGSTNDLAKEAGLAGEPGGTVFVADHQTRGRGRMDRSWLEAPASSLLFSVLFRRDLSPILLTMLCSVAACQAIEETAGAVPEIKWPNDLMLNGRKLAGVLTEVNWAPDGRFAVVGMGINANFIPSSVDGIPSTATSLLAETGRAVDRPPLLRAILSRLDVLLRLEDDALEPVVRREWASRLWRQRQRVTVADGSSVLEGIFEGVDEDGALLMRLDDGSLLPVRVGDLLI